jgi:hypothetical protein
MQQIKTYKPKTIAFPKKAKYTQGVNNCWIYSILNNLYLNTGILVDAKQFEAYLKSYKINTTRKNSSYLSGSMICKFLQSKKLELFELDVLTDTKLFSKLLLAGYSFVYNRYSNDAILKDIKDNKTINNIIQKEG